MSGIVGTYHEDGRPARRAVLGQMLARMAHRGPDGQGVWCDGPVGLGHALLHTTPESLHEEMPAQRGNLTITADARIDNRGELMRALSMREREPIPDSTLILSAYAQWGVDLLQHLIGDFAFALWDAAEQRLVCARDHMGVRPLYYHHGEDGRLAFGSEIKAILAHPSIDTTLHEERLVDLLLGTRTDRAATIYQGIKRLPPAHILVATPDGLTVQRYWTLTPDETVGDDWSDEAYAERFRALFDEAVRCRTRSAFPVGADLSGGLDSSAVACVARDVLAEDVLAETDRTPLHAFSYVFDASPESDERDYARAVLDQGGFAPHWLSGDDVGPLTDLDTIYGSVIDDYLVGGMHYMIWKTFNAAQKEGVRIMLNGFDGDTTVSHGVLRLRELVEGGDWKTFSKEALRLSQRHSDLDHKQPFEEMLGSAGALYNEFAKPQLEALAGAKRWGAFWRAARILSQYFTVSTGSLVRQYWRYLFLPDSLRHWPHDAGAPSAGSEAASEATASEATAPEGAASSETAARKLQLLHDDVRRRFNAAERLDAQADQRAALFEGVRAKQRAQFAMPALTEGLEAMNHYGAYHRLVPQFPFMDVRLIRFCLALPPRQSLQNGWTRVVFRRAMKGVLPESIRRRVGKARMWSANRNALLNQNAESLQRHVHALGPLGQYVDPRPVRSLFTERYHLKPHEFILLQRTATLAAWTKLRFDPNRDTSSPHIEHTM
jgi:asparagine synthase (glutamine-hydrolysing)